jgi:hypothetical protein
MEGRMVTFEESRAIRRPIGATLQEIKDWRTKRYEAGESSGFDDYCRAHGLCTFCDAQGVVQNENGIGFKAVAMEGNTQYFLLCEHCFGTGHDSIA